MENTKKLKFSCLDLVSNTEGDSVSATGLCGTVIIFVALFVYIACVAFYFFNVSEANNIFTLLNTTTTILGIGSGVLGVRRISSDFGPNNRIVMDNGRKQRKKKSVNKETTEETETEE